MNDATLHRLLTETRTIAIVGLSDDPARASHSVGRYLQAHGYRIIPVNPKCTEVLGEKSYPDLQAIPGSVDLVNVFRRPEHCVEIAEAAVSIGAKALWLQLGVVNEEAQRIAEEGGLMVVMDHCIKVEHSSLIG